MRSRRSAALAALLVLATLPVLAGGAAAGGGTGTTARHQSIVAHWTEARMRAARPRDFLFDAVRGYHISPNKRPGPGGGNGNTTGASWPNGKGLVYKVTGKVYFEMGGSGWVCSGTALSDGRNTYSLVITAGHCVYDEASGGGLSGFATNWLFIPQFDSSPTFTCGSTAFGCWTATALVANRGFTSAGSFNNTAAKFDWGFAVVGNGGLTGAASPQLDQTVGTFGYQFSEMGLNTVADAFGYPAAGKYHGNDLTYCTGPTFNDVYNANQTWGINCDMTGGSSGGPWIAAFTSTNPANPPTLTSLNSYGYNGLSNMYGPKFNSDTQAVWTRADSSSSNQLVP